VVAERWRLVVAERWRLVVAERWRLMHPIYMTTYLEIRTRSEPGKANALWHQELRRVSKGPVGPHCPAFYSNLPLPDFYLTLVPLVILDKTTASITIRSPRTRDQGTLLPMYLCQAIDSRGCRQC
jgi:hypothetical protein